MSVTTIAPVSERERIEILDVLRGLAICGILLGNMQWFAGYGMMPPFMAGQAPAADKLTSFLVHFFVEGKFYSVFSFLFGFGFAIQISRAEERGDTNASLFKRRLVWLLVIGLLHAYLLWAGDILSIYAVTGFLLIPFRKKPNRSLIKWALILFAVPVLFYALLYALLVAFVPAGANVMPNEGEQAAQWRGMSQLVSQGGYFDIITHYNLRYVVGRYMGLIFEMRFPKLLATFLLGYYAYRRGFFTNIEAHRPFIKRVLVYTLVLGLVGNALLATAMVENAVMPPSLFGLVGVIGYAFGVPSLALFYIAAVALLWRGDVWRRALSLVAPVGRMALTNYLLQTLVCVVIFYGFGFGLYGTMGAARATLVALAVFAFQVVVSWLWMRSFSYGPAEWIWRQLTYKRRLSLRARPAARVEGEATT